MRFLLTFLFFTICLQAQAAIKNLNVRGGASQLVGTPVTDVWGVMVGVPDNSSPTPYNNCPTSLPDDEFTGCHENRVNGSHIITVEFTETEEVNGAPGAFIKARVTGGSETTTQSLRVDARGAVQNGKDKTGSVSFTWERLCQLITTADNKKGKLDSTLNRCVIDGSPVNGTFIITFGFDSHTNTNDTTSTATLNFYLYSPPFTPGANNGTANLDCSNQDYGFCDISLFPGDGGGTLSPPEGSEQINKLVGGTSASILAEDAFKSDTKSITIKIERLRLYYSSLDHATAHPSAGNDLFSDHFIDPNQSSGDSVVFQDPEFGGLTNGTGYIFRGATVDSSGLISYIMDSDFCPDGKREPNSSEQCSKYSFIPSEVAGLITESSCFITSATYGSPQAHQVTLFRKFRAKYLWTNSLGKSISNTYNKYGPIGAKWIYENPSSRKIIRIGLYPFYGFAFLSVHYGFITASLIYLFSLVVLSLGLIKVFSKGRV